MKNEPQGIQQQRWQGQKRREKSGHKEQPRKGPSIPEIKTRVQPSYIRSLFNYDPETGYLTLRLPSRGRALGERAEFESGDGYLTVAILGAHIKAHTIAWVHFHGEWPEIVTDHINGDKQDNRISNLRAATHSENAWNMKRSALNTSGVKGVSKQKGRFVASVMKAGMLAYNQSFATIEEAESAVKEARIRLHGEFHRHE